MHVISQLTFERDHRVGDGPIASCNQKLLAAVRREKQEVSPRLHGDGLGKVCVKTFVDFVASAEGAYINNIVIITNGFISGNMRNDKVDIIGKPSLPVRGCLEVASAE